jgi:hypothetical protein
MPYRTIPTMLAQADPQQDLFPQGARARTVEEQLREGGVRVPVAYGPPPRRRARRGRPRWLVLLYRALSRG